MNIFGKYIIVIALLGACWSCQEKTENTLFLSLEAKKTGISFVNQLVETPDFNILEYLYFYNGAGVATGDINNDGLPDIFLVSNQGQNKLYLNKGNLQFQDISEKAKITGTSDWKTGVTMTDINADGWLDIYVCAVANYKGLQGHNELYINNKNGTFSEESKKYDLDFQGFSTQAAFFDFDHDGDLDMFLLNHAVHTIRSYGRVETRSDDDSTAGDYLFRNDNGRFIDISRQASILKAPQGYGLGIAIADLNNDGWDDIYVSNDFHEDDYCYINNQNGTFTERVKEYFGHLSRFSMGLDIADINNDGWQDIFTTDMYPSDRTVEKSSAGEDPFDIFRYKLAYGYYNQYSRNCLQLNMGAGQFSEIGSMAGVAATDWSWSALLADFDNDTHKDLFVSNGIVRRPNDLDYIKYIANDSVQFQLNQSKNFTLEALKEMPDGRFHNFCYKGAKNLYFNDVSDTWGMTEPNYANGASYADLDNDGDLDLVTNNINSQASIYQNTSEKNKNNFLKIKLKGKPKNTQGIGAKVFVFAGGEAQMQEQQPTRGFMSGVDPVLCFGLAKNLVADSVAIVWGSGKTEVQRKIMANTRLTFDENEASIGTMSVCVTTSRTPPFTDISAQYSQQFSHRENLFYDFNQEPLVPFMVSTEGPKMAVADVNADGLDDVYLCQASGSPKKMLIQQANGKFKEQSAAWFADSLWEDIDAVFFDADADKDLDLYVVSGGNQFLEELPYYHDRLYLNDGKGFFAKSTTALPALQGNKSCVRPFDFDADGDIDLFVGGRSVPLHYGETPRSYLLQNNGKGVFKDVTAQIAPDLVALGMITDAVWTDVDQDEIPDLLLVGEWQSPVFFRQEKTKFKKVVTAGFENLSGFWHSVAAADFDKDGDTDYVLGNLGTNTKFRKNENSRLRMWVGDIDNNQTTDQILVEEINEKWYPVAFKDELGKQMPAIINKKFTTTKAFAGKTVEEVFDKNELQYSHRKDVNNFASVYLENTGNGTFNIKLLPALAQVSKIFALHVTDTNADGNLDILLGGNFYGVSTYQGQYDALHGLLLMGNGKGDFNAITPMQSGFLVNGEVRDIKAVKINAVNCIFVARNNASVQVFRLGK